MNFARWLNKVDIKEISAEEFYHLKSEGEDFQLIDVREPDEYAVFNIEVTWFL
jgi:rhodanese-related sulfurtransferase